MHAFVLGRQPLRSPDLDAVFRSPGRVTLFPRPGISLYASRTAQKEKPPTRSAKIFRPEVVAGLMVTVCILLAIAIAFTF